MLDFLCDGEWNNAKKLKPKAMNFINYMGFRPIHELLMHHDSYEYVKKLCENGADVNARDEHGWHPLATAAWNNRIGGTRALLECGADPSVIAHVYHYGLCRGRMHRASACHTRLGSARPHS